MSDIKKAVYYIITAIATIAVFAGVHHYLISSFLNTASEKNTVLSVTIKQSRDFVAYLTLFSHEYFKSAELNRESERYREVEYDPELNSFCLNEADFGTLRGIGPIPDSGIKKVEMNMALSYSEFFKSAYGKIPDVSWIYYTSQNDFILMYPQSPDDFTYTDNLHGVAFYAVATPENNPLREEKWTTVYLDKAGKGLMVTISSPVYFDDDFMGVISLDLTTDVIREHLSSKYDSFLIDQDNSVIATGQNHDFSDSIVKFGDLIDISESNMQKIREIKSGTIERVGVNYYYKSDLVSAPWSFVMKESAVTIALEAAALSLPMFIICALLFSATVEAENRKKAEEEARAIAITDKLTGLNNRYFLDAVIGKYFQSANRYGQHLSVITFDLDNFKRVNDTWGHEIGDEVLIQTANTAKNLLREADSIVRIGGEEFLILLPETDNRGAYAVAEKIRKALESEAHPTAGVCTASFGVAEMVKGETYSNLYRRADVALYMAKESGRNCVFSYEATGGLYENSVTVKWNSDWNSGNRIIDKQHQELIEMTNGIMSVALHTFEFSDIEKRLDFLLKRLGDHFKEEEQIIADIAYPQLEEHREKHKVLIEKALMLKEAYKRGEVKSTVFFAFIVRDALVGHLAEDDMGFFPYLNGNLNVQKE